MMAMRELRAGRLIPVPPVEKALRYLERQGDAVPAGGGRRMTLGTGEQVRAGLEDLAAQYGAEEVIVVTITHDPQARRRSYELIADAFAPRRREGTRRSSCGLTSAACRPGPSARPCRAGSGSRSGRATPAPRTR